MAPSPGPRTQGAFIRLLLDLLDAGEDSARPGPERVLCELCRLLEVDLLYTVLPAEGGWTKRAYAAQGEKGSVTISRPTGIVRHVLSRRSRFLEARISPRGPFLRHQDGWPGVAASSYLAVPIHRRGRARGVLVLVRSEALPPFETGEIPRAEWLAEALAIGFDLAQRLRDLEDLSRTDGLTLLPNYRSARDLLQRELQKAQQLGRRLAVVLFDAHAFRSAGPGYLAGIELLRRSGRALERSIRASDIIARLGGDEFLLILPHTDRDGAERAVGRIAGALATELSAGDLSAGIRAGIASFPEDGEDFSSLVDACARAASQAAPLAPPRAQGRGPNAEQENPEEESEGKEEEDEGEDGAPPSERPEDPGERAAA